MEKHNSNQDLDSDTSRCTATFKRDRISTMENHIKTLEKEQSELYDVIGHYAKHYEKIASLHLMSSAEDVPERLFRILRKVMDFTAFQVLHWVPSKNRYDIGASFNAEDTDMSLTCEQSLIDWALDNKTVSMVPVEDKDLLDKNIKGIIIVPLNGREGKLGALVIWSEYDPTTSNRFIVDLLKFLSKDVSGVFDNLQTMQRSRNISLLMDGIIESVPQAIIAIDRNNKLLACNSNAEFMFNFKRVFALDEHYTEVLPEQLVPVISSLIKSTLSGNHEIDYETEYSVADGMTMTIGISTSLLYNREGGAQGILLICRDLSLSREVQKLREIDQMKDEFVHTVSHELKTPLTSIMGCAETLLEIKDTLPEDYAEMLDILVEGSERLKELITDLLDMSRLQTGRMVLDREPCDISMAVCEIVATLEGNKNKCALVVNSPDDLPPIDADYDKMKQVFQNIIGNAVKYSPSGGEVRIDVEHDAASVTVRVLDQGLGIPKKQLPFIFDKFFRVDSSTTASIEGTGLGLSIAKHIIDLHDGEVRVESVEGKGTTFILKLPAGN